MKVSTEQLNEIILDEYRKLLEEKKSKAYGGKKPDFSSWTPSRIKKYWKTFSEHYPTFDEKVKALKRHPKITDPEGFVSTLEKKATSRWPAEEGS